MTAPIASTHGFANQEFANQEFANELANGSAQSGLARNGGSDAIGGTLLSPGAIPRSPSAGWYLGLDLGTTSLGLVLLNQITGQSYPIYWRKTGGDGRPNGPIWRLPGQTQRHSETGEALTDQGLVSDLKPALNIALPYRTADHQTWHPQLNWITSRSTWGTHNRVHQPISLMALRQSLRSLLATLHPHYVAPGGSYEVGLLGLPDPQAKQALAALEGIVVNASAGASEAYRFNVRELILDTGLVERPEQIAFLEDAIAALLAEFHPSRQRSFPTVWHGGTLVLSMGASAMDLALVCLPNALHNLNYEDFQLRSFGYGGQALAQDIALQLLYPMLPQEQMPLPIGPMPLVGEPDAQVRHDLQRQLHSSPIGQMLLEAAVYLNQALQHRDRLTFEFGAHAYTFSREALQAKVMQPFLHRLNRELNQLLSQLGMENDGVFQVLCTGSAGSLPLITQWLRQRFPQARILSDYPDVAAQATELRAEDAPNSLYPTFMQHRIAYGLVTLPLYPQLLNQAGSQYSDFFLLLELLRSLPNQPLSISHILKILESRGINTQSCRHRILALLEDQQLPPGWIPDPDDGRLTEASNQSPDYVAMRSQPLFVKQGRQFYYIDPHQRDRFLAYWQQVGARQLLTDPYVLQVGLQSGLPSASAS